MAKDMVKVLIVRNTRVNGESCPAFIGEGDKAKPNIVTVDSDTAAKLVAAQKGLLVVEKGKAGGGRD